MLPFDFLHHFYPTKYIPMKNLQFLTFTLFSLLIVNNNYCQNAFSGIFHQKPDSTILLKDVSWETLAAQQEARSKKGFLLKDVETIEDEGKRKYFALWSADTTASKLYQIPGWDSLVQIKRKMAREGYMMTDIEAYPQEDGRNHFLCVWKEQRIWHKVWKLDTWEGVLQKNEEMLKKYMYLRDVEIIKSPSDGWKFLVIYHEGDRDRKERGYIFKSDDLKTFTTDLMRRQKSGFQMIDFETYQESGKKIYVAVYQKGYEADTWRQNLDAKSFEAHSKVLKTNQFQLIDFEVSEGTGRLLIPIVDTSSK